MWKKHTISFSMQQVVDFTGSSEDIIIQYADLDALVCYFYGHPILLQGIEKIVLSKYRKGIEALKQAGILLYEKTKQSIQADGQNNSSVLFSIGNDGSLLIPSLGLKINHYKIWVTHNYFVDCSFNDFIKTSPECQKLYFKDRSCLNWQETCDFEKRIKSNRNFSDKGHKFIEDEFRTYKIEDSQPLSSAEYLGEYIGGIYNESKAFAGHLVKKMGNDKKILDFGSGDLPWFALLCRDVGFKSCTAYDLSKPTNPEFLKQKGIRYIHSDINSYQDHSAELTNIDFLFCRNLSPPQKLINWFDSSFINLWQSLIDSLSDKGMIHWIQMTNGTGNADSFFANHDLSTFKRFFKQFNVDFNIAKFGYARFMVSKKSKNNLAKIILNSYQEAVTINPDTLKNHDDIIKLKVKNYAYQLQKANFYFCDNLNSEVSIFTNPEDTLVIKTLLEDNFRFTNIKCYPSADLFTVKFKNDEYSKEFHLSSGLKSNNDFYIVDGQEDLRFVTEFFDIVKSKLGLPINYSEFPSEGS